MPILSGVEKLKLHLDAEMMPTEWQNGEIDGTTWHQLLRSFIGVKKLSVCHSLVQELSRALRMNDVGSDPRLLPCLQVLRCKPKGVFEPILFDPFISARRVAGRPVQLIPAATLGRVVKLSFPPGEGGVQLIEVSS